MKTKTAPNGRGAFPDGLDPYSSDALVDFIFREFISLLENIIDKISKKENLKDSDTGCKLWGLLIQAVERTEVSEIFLEAKQEPKRMLYIFIHELVHALFHDKMSERKVEQLTKILWRRLTEDQKKILRSYIPKHKVKGGPPNVSKTT